MLLFCSSGHALNLSGCVTPWIYVRKSEQFCNIIFWLQLKWYCFVDLAAQSFDILFWWLTKTAFQPKWTLMTSTIHGESLMLQINSALSASFAASHSMFWTFVRGLELSRYTASKKHQALNSVTGSSPTVTTFISVARTARLVVAQIIIPVSAVWHGFHVKFSVGSMEMQVIFWPWKNSWIFGFDYRANHVHWIQWVPGLVQKFRAYPHHYLLEQVSDFL